MKLIVGLGNPGKEYINTRHNIGFELLDFFASKYNFSFNKHKFNGEYAEFNFNGEKIIFLKPLSFMNLSGSVVSKYVSFFKINLDDILIIHDDLDMNFGRIKVVYDSSSGGHNGIKDIEKFIGTKKYTRLKIGISNDKTVDTKDYVLGKFTDDEINEIKLIFINLSDFVFDFCSKNLDELMCKYNRK